MAQLNPTPSNPDDQQGEHNQDMGLTMMLMMAMCCAPILVIAVLIPFLGFPLGVLVTILAVGAAFLAHRKWMRHGNRHC